MKIGSIKLADSRKKGENPAFCGRTVFFSVDQF